MKNMLFNNKALQLYTISIIFLLVSWLNVQDSVAQVTFSRNWNAGKRTPDNPDFHFKISANNICHYLMNQIRQMVSCESPGEETAPFFNGKFNL